MKLILFADLHARNWMAFKKELATGRNSRLENCLEIIRQIAKLSKDTDARAVLFLGDVFHTRFQIDVDVYDAVYKEISEASKVCPWYLLRGNHDTFDTEGKVHSLVSMGNGRITVLDQVYAFKIDDTNVFAIPWYADEEYIRGILQHDGCSGDILLLHAALKEGTVGKGNYRTDAPLSVSDLPVGSFKRIFLGDFHKHQELVPDKVMYLGSPLQHTFGEANEDKWLFIYDTDTDTIEKRLTESPRFYEIGSIAEFESKVNVNDIDPEYDFIRVLYTFVEQEKVQELVSEFPDVMFERTSALPTERTEDSGVLNDDDVLVAKYVSENEQEDTDNSILVDYGLEILGRVT